MDHSRRMQRVQKELRSLISTYVLTRLDQLPHKFIAINNVICSKDLQHAKVFVGSFGDRPVQGIVDRLNKGAREIQSYIGRELPMRYCPRLMFIKDDTTETILRIETALAGIAADTSKAQVP